MKLQRVIGAFVAAALLVSPSIAQTCNDGPLDLTPLLNLTEDLYFYSRGSHIYWRPCAIVSDANCQDASNPQTQNATVCRVFSTDGGTTNQTQNFGVWQGAVVRYTVPTGPYAGMITSQQNGQEFWIDQGNGVLGQTLGAVIVEWMCDASIPTAAIFTATVSPPLINMKVLSALACGQRNMTKPPPKASSLTSCTNYDGSQYRLSLCPRNAGSAGYYPMELTPVQGAGLPFNVTLFNQTRSAIMSPSFQQGALFLTSLGAQLNTIPPLTDLPFYGIDPSLNPIVAAFNTAGFARASLNRGYMAPRPFIGFGTAGNAPNRLLVVRCTDYRHQQDILWNDRINTWDYVFFEAEPEKLQIMYYETWPSNSNVTIGVSGDDAGMFAHVLTSAPLTVDMAAMLQGSTLTLSLLSTASSCSSTGAAAESSSSQSSSVPESSSSQSSSVPDSLLSSSSVTESSSSSSVTESSSSSSVTESSSSSSVTESSSSSSVTESSSPFASSSSSLVNESSTGMVNPSSESSSSSSPAVGSSSESSAHVNASVDASSSSTAANIGSNSSSSASNGCTSEPSVSSTVSSSSSSVLSSSGATQSQCLAENWMGQSLDDFAAGLPPGSTQLNFVLTGASLPLPGNFDIAFANDIAVNIAFVLDLDSAAVDAILVFVDVSQASTCVDSNSRRRRLLSVTSDTPIILTSFIMGNITSVINNTSSLNIDSTFAAQLADMIRVRAATGDFVTPSTQVSIAAASVGSIDASLLQPVSSTGGEITEDESTSASSWSTGNIAGATVGIVVGSLLLLAAIVYACLLHKRPSSQEGVAPWSVQLASSAKQSKPGGIHWIGV